MADQDWLEAVLTKKAYEDSPIRVLAIEEGGDAPGKGENFLSKIRKIRAEVLLGSGKITNLPLLIKTEPAVEHVKKLSVEGGIFLREITMYRDVLPKMQELLEEMNDPDGVFWPKCYDVRLYDRLVLEDLSGAGYRMANRKEQLSLNAALMAVKQFAKFHALSRILMDRGEISLDIFGQYMMLRSPEKQGFVRKMVEANVKGMCEIVKTWGDEWKGALERLGKADLQQSYVDSLRAEPNEFAVLCHGDTWTNNLMFQGDDLENPTSVRLIDFQICYVTSPAKDLIQFFTTSVRLEDRKHSTDTLFQAYTDTLSSFLLKLGYSGDIPTVEDIKRSYESRASMQLNVAMGFVPVAMGEVGDAPDMEDALKKTNEAKDEVDKTFLTIEKKISSRCEPIIKYEIMRAMDSGLI